MFDRCMKQSKEKAFELVDKLGVKLTSEDKEHHEKQLMKVNAHSSSSVHYDGKLF